MFNIYVYKLSVLGLDRDLAVSGCGWVVEASWSTGMNDSFHMNTQSCAVEEAAKVSEKKTKTQQHFIHIKAASDIVLVRLLSAHHMLQRCDMPGAGSHFSLTLGY